MDQESQPRSHSEHGHGRLLLKALNPKDFGCRFSPNADVNDYATCARIKKKTRIKSMEARTITTAHTSICRPILSDTQLKNLQSTQNSPFRTATVCHLMSHADHLHAET